MADDENTAKAPSYTVVGLNTGYKFNYGSWGMTRAVLARELSLEQIKHICAESPIEIEVFVHGALCFCHSGQCYMSALIGRRSGNRGMNKIIKSDRLVVLSALLVILLCVYFVFLYKLQIIEGADYSEKSANSLASVQTVTAARGNILDRYGRVLVTNQPSYNITIDTTELFDEKDPNAVILQLVNFVKDQGASYTDTLPITTSPPFEYTDMTDSQKSTLKAYLKAKNLDESTSAVELMSYMRTGEQVKLPPEEAASFIKEGVERLNSGSIIIEK